MYDKIRSWDEGFGENQTLDPIKHITHLSSGMAGHKIAHATLKGPSVVKEICYGMVLALATGSLWKMHHWNEQRKVRVFYDLLEKGEISVVAEE
ncbi:hypothetical protein ACE6H2_028802 [Prunus campanulata]